MEYKKLHKDSFCNNCVGCERLSNPYFTGILSNARKDNPITCPNFQECYSDEEKAAILRETNAYGSMYGNND